MERQPNASTSAPPPSVAAIIAQRGYGGHHSQSPAALFGREYGGYQRGRGRDYQPVAYRLRYAQRKHEWKRGRESD